MGGSSDLGLLPVINGGGFFLDQWEGRLTCSRGTSSPGPSSSLEGVPDTVILACIACMMNVYELAAV